MNELKAALTAFGTSLIRAVHTRTDPHPLFVDSWGDQLVPHEALEVFRQRAVDRLSAAGIAYVDPPGAPRYAILDATLPRSPMFAEIVIRSRYTEDALCEAVSMGIGQYVLVGAGFDSFVLRRPAFARGIAVIEVDQKKTQALKLERIAQCGLIPSQPVHFIAANFNEEELPAVLARTPFKSGERAFFSWLGVTLYLTREVNLSALRSFAACAAPGSELVFTYLDQDAMFSDAISEPFRSLRDWVSSIGEPWLSGFDPKSIDEDLHGAGLELIEDLDGPHMVERYHRGGADGWGLEPLCHIAHARVA